MHASTDTSPAAEQLAEWIAGQTPGSVIEATLQPRSRELEAFCNLGWRALYLNPDPSEVSAAAALLHSRYGANVSCLCARLDLQDRRFLPGVQPGTISVGIHPNQLYPFFVEDNPPLPEPRFAIIDGFRNLDTLTQWARIDGFRLTVTDNEEAKLAGDWFSTAWKVLGTDGLTVWAVRGF